MAGEGPARERWEEGGREGEGEGEGGRKQREGENGRKRGRASGIRVK